jgi:photosystem II stability/assembly factor-like uncharacterized protein/predicted aspartyl protease
MNPDLLQTRNDAGRSPRQLMKGRLFLMLCGMVFCSEAALGQWKAQSSGTSADFRGVSAASRTVVWASGSRGTYTRTTDGGATWRAGVVPGAEALDFRDVQAVDANTAYLLNAGAPAKIYKTTDGGRRWSLQYTNTTAGIFFDAMAFWDADHGIAFSDPVGGSFVIITTADGGANWKEVPRENIPPPLAGEAAFAASGTCLAVQGRDNAWFGTGGGAQSRVFRSTDRGQTWKVAVTPIKSGNATNGIFSLAFRDARNGVAVGGDYQKTEEASDNVARTTDGGATWTQGGRSEPPGLKEGIVYVPGTPAPTLIAVGPSGSGYSLDDGKSWTSIDRGGYHSLSFTGPTGAGWAVGAGGRIAKYMGAVPGARRRGRSRAGGKVAAIPFEISGNLIFLQVRINDSAPLWFILDTGASVHVIKQQRAAELGLKLESDEQAFGGTPGAKGVSLSLTGARLVNQTIFAAPTESLEPSVGRNVDGILGYDLFNSFVVEIDYLARRLNLYESKDYRYQGRGEAIPIIIEDNTPFVRARLTQPAANSAEGKFLVDTGASNALNVFAPFDNAHRFSSSVTKMLQSAGVGFTSKSRTRTGRIHRLQLGRLIINNVVASFSPMAEGEASEDEAGDGEIGGELLRRFKVIVDSARGRIILEPNAAYGEPFHGSLTGVSIAAEGPDFKTFKARSVLDHSPAAEAGLRAGDIITAINGQPASRFTAEQLRRMFRQEGRNYILNIRRGGESLRVSLRTRRLI